MKIAIEAQRIFRLNKHGMDFVALETLRCLQRIDTRNEYFVFVSPGPDRCLAESDNLHIIEVTTPSYPLWEQVGLPRAVRRVAPDLLHCTSNTAPVWCAASLVLTLHDIIFLERQQAANKSLYQKMGRLYRRLVVPRILDKCEKIVTVSEFERQRILSSLGLDPEVVLPLLKHVLRTRKVRGFDICEISPRFDQDNTTANLGAVIIFAVINTLCRMNGLEYAAE